MKPLEGGEVLQAGPAPGSDPIYHDCLWSLRPSPGTYISVHVLKFKVREGVYVGPTRRHLTSVNTILPADLSPGFITLKVSF